MARIAVEICILCKAMSCMALFILRLHRSYHHRQRSLL
jgi:hypothetical protein